jgi:hypothetical protein
LELKLKRIVIRSTGICYQLSESKQIWIGEGNAGRLYKTPSGGPNVRDSHSLLLAQRLFDGNIPLQRVG